MTYAYTGKQPRFDVEVLMLAVRRKIIEDFNDTLTGVMADKANLASTTQADQAYLYPQLPIDAPIKMLGNGDDPGQAVDILRLNIKNFKYDPYITILESAKKQIANQSENIVRLDIFFTIKDPRDNTGPIRLHRYMRTLETIFDPRRGGKTGIASLNATELMPYLEGPDKRDQETKRLVWGLGLTFTW